MSFSLRKCVLRHAVGSGSQGAGFCATCIASCIALLTARDTEPGEFQLRSSLCLSAPERRALPLHFCSLFVRGDERVSRECALISIWNWQRRAASAVYAPLPVAAGATAAAEKGLAAWLAG